MPVARMLAPWVYADVCVTLDPGKGQSLGRKPRKVVPASLRNLLNGMRLRRPYLIG
jgi:hypothetical protein